MQLPSFLRRFFAVAPPADPDSLEGWTWFLLYDQDKAELALTECATPGRVPMLFELLRDCRYQVSYSAARALQKVQDSPEFAAALDAKLSAPLDLKGEVPVWNRERPWHGGGLTLLLSGLDESRAEGILRELLSSSEPERLAWAARLFPTLNPQERMLTDLKPQLLSLIEKPHLTQLERRSVIESLDLIGATAEEYEQCADVLRREMDLPALRSALESPHDEEALAAATILSVTGDFGSIAAARLGAMLSREKVRAEALHILSEFGPYAAAATPAVMELLPTGDHCLSQSVKNAIIHFGAEAVPILVRRLPEEQNPRVSARIARIFGGMLYEPNGRQHFQLRATSVAFQACRSTIRKALEDAALSHPDNATRFAAVRALDNCVNDHERATSHLNLLRVMVRDGEGNYIAAGPIAAYISRSSLVEEVLESGTPEEQAEARALAAQHGISYRQEKKS